MTEADWLACDDPELLSKSAGRKVSTRKRRLLVCASCYRVWSLISKPECRAALVAAEQFADGLIDGAELERRRRAASGVAFEASAPASEQYARRASTLTAYKHPGHKVWEVVIFAVRLRVAEEQCINPTRRNFAAVTAEAKAAETAQQVALLRDIFGNPFRPVVLSPTWRTDTVLLLARQMYESRDFSAMPILADALQDAGCDSEKILNHCRDTKQIHVRGCWVVDLVLGKE